MKAAEGLEATGISKDSPILDMGWGTGLVAVQLVKKGFTTIDGIDASTGMLDYAREKELYRNLDELPHFILKIYNLCII